MLMIISFTNPHTAQTSVDYMAIRGVTLTIRQHQQTDVWLADESWAEHVHAKLTRFLENPDDPHYLAASWQSSQTDSSLHYQRYSSLTILRERVGPVTWLVMATYVLVFITMSVPGDQAVMLWLTWPFDPSLKLKSWCYFTRTFMHFLLMHILFNPLRWWCLSGVTERRLGNGKLVVITVISILLSGYIQQKFSGPWSGGLSGVVCALMGYVWLRGEHDPRSGIFLQRGLIIFALVRIAAGWFDLFGMSMANSAHIAGLAVGLATAFANTTNIRKRAWFEFCGAGRQCTPGPIYRPDKRQRVRQDSRGP